MSAGHIRPRGNGSWELKYDAGHDPQTGRRLTRYKTVRGRKSDAQAELRRLLGTVDTGQHIEPSKVTVAALVAERIKVWRSTGRISAKTAERREQLAARQIGLIGSIQIQKLGTADVEKWHAAMLADGLAPRTVRDAHNLLAQSLDEAAKHGTVHRNVARLQKPPRVPREEVEIIPAEDIVPTLAKLEGDAFYIPVIVARDTGLRRGEQLALRWSHVDLDVAKVLHVREALEETKEHGIQVKAPKTAAGKRTVSLPDRVVDALRDHRRQQLELRMALGAGKMPDDALVFPGHDFGHQSPRNFSTAWTRTVNRLGLPRVTWHAWRHTHASEIISLRIDIATIAKRLGHASPAITLATYAHCFKGDDRSVADAINALTG